SPRFEPIPMYAFMTGSRAGATAKRPLSYNEVPTITTSIREEASDESESGRCMGGGEALVHRGGRHSGAEGRRGARAAGRDRRVSYRRVHPFGRRPGGRISGHPRS